MKNLIYLALIASAISCKPKETILPTSPPPADMRPRVSYQKDIKLYNQFVTDPSVKHFYKFTDGSFTDDPKADFDLCYLNTSFQGNNYFVLGSPSDKVYTQKSEAYPLTANGSSNFTSFYKLPAAFSYANFDTLQISSGLKDLIENKSTIIYSNVALQLSMALLSDSFGWSPKSVFGIKTSKGKYGVLKFLTSPTGSITTVDPLAKAGVLSLEVKIEK